MECPRCGFNNPAEFEFCGKCGASLSGDPPEAGAARSRLPPMMAGADAADAAAEIAALVQQVLRQAYLEANEDLRFYAEKVRYFNAVKKAIRDHISDMREKLSDARGKSGVRVRTITVRPSPKIRREPGGSGSNAGLQNRGAI